jgi:predicted nucleotidyltransferase
MLDPSTNRQRVREICRRYGVVRLDVFGSVGRDTDEDDSDIDLLYTLGPGVHLGWAIEDLEAELSAAFGRPVDLVSREALNPRIRKTVLNEARLLYAA